MEMFFISIPSVFIIIFFFSIIFSSSSSSASRLLPIINENGGNSTSATKVYIIHVAEPNNTQFLHFTDKENWYKSFLPNTSLDSGDPRLIYSYHHVITGFAAKLTDDELKAVESRDGFIYAQEDQAHILHTTYTPTYLKLHQNWDYDLWTSSSYGAGKIIGVIDSGIDPDHPSFNDNGMPQAPLPPVWTGKCFWPNKCNRKLIGIRAFRHGWAPDPYDRNGHGTHVASTAAGNFVDDAHVLGQANGRASGMAPLAHLAIYKVLYNHNGKTVGMSTDIFAGIDWAIRDGVHILQMSLGSVSLQMFHNPVAVASFAAMKKGIVPCAAAANEGPTPKIIANDAPWILSVGASSTDRRILTSVVLGDGNQLDGEGGYHPDNFTPDQLPLVYPGADDSGTPKQRENRLVCNVPLKAYDVQGKVVVCWNAIFDPVEIGEKVKKAGGVAMILINTWLAGDTTSPEPHVLPVANVGYDVGQQLVAYINSTANATATIILNGTQFSVKPTPAVASFSSRGPSKMNYGIIKPDIIAPGVNILAAWPQRVGPSPTGSYSKFKFLSGTSMATPHVSGIVALLMNLYPNWSPARIKSALMTTAYTFNSNGEPIKDEYGSGNASVYAMGSGHVDPLAATNPGLVYDLQYYNYVHYLCGTGMADYQVSAIVQVSASCSQINGIPVEQLNYPSFSVKLGAGNPVTVTRSVTNVGDANSAYHVDFEEPEGVNIAVNPNTLQFSQKEETLKFEVKFTVDGVPPASGMTREGYLSWVSPTNVVRSPIVVTFI